MKSKWKCWVKLPGYIRYYCFHYQHRSVPSLFTSWWQFCCHPSNVLCRFIRQFGSCKIAPFSKGFILRIVSNFISSKCLFARSNLRFWGLHFSNFTDDQFYFYSSSAVGRLQVLGHRLLHSRLGVAHPDLGTYANNAAAIINPAPSLSDAQITIIIWKET